MSRRPLPLLADLEDRLRRIDGSGYKAYKGIRGSYRGDGFELKVAYVQGDPFAAPSRLEVFVDPGRARLPPALCLTEARRAGAADAVLRRLVRAARRASDRDAGSGKSGQISADTPGQEMLRRTACEVDPDGTVVLRFFVGLPAAGRRVLGRKAATLLGRRVPEVIARAAFDLDDVPAVRAHAHAAEDQQALRDQLAERGLVAFLADGAVLPRASGDSQKPMPAGAVPWTSPPTLAVTLDAPNAGPITGTGLPAGVTLVCGGGYHGKSTMLDAIARGIYDHVPGDGRERVVTRPAAVTIRAEDGRAVTGVDISPFIGALPGGRATTGFSTGDASGSTSQAAAVVEALELGADVLLLDEDTCATNFMIRDRRMQALVAPEHEPITPLLDRITGLREALDTSLVLVMGGSGDYFDVADTVIVMRDYRAHDETEHARAIAAELPTGRQREGSGAFPRVAPRIPKPAAFDLSKGRKDVSAKARETRLLELGRERVEIGALEQLVHPSQARTIADAIAFAVEEGLVDGKASLRELATTLERRLDERGPTAFCRYEAEADRAAVRALEIGAAINRLRSLAVRPG